MAPSVTSSTVSESIEPGLLETASCMAYDVSLESKMTYSRLAIWSLMLVFGIPTPTSGSILPPASANTQSRLD